jgi:diphosphomevalonate decarboxylase
MQMLTYRPLFRGRFVLFSTHRGKREYPSAPAGSLATPLVPINSSLSAGIDQGSMKSLTTIIASKAFAADTMVLNDKEESIDKNPRMKDVIQNLKKRAQPLIVDGVEKISSADWSNYKLKIISVNNFPTAAGLASSASGYACFTKCLATLYGVQEAYEGELSTIARQGSGSACRSMYGGWVAWRMGEREDGVDSIAQQVQPHTHWPDMRVLILVANSGQKETSSTEGMQRSVRTSPLLAHRAAVVVPERMKQMEAFIEKRDFTGFANLTMADSNQFHATCVDTLPPIFYMNETSKAVIHLVHAFNNYKKEVKAAYTFDAGPNAVVFVLKQDMEELLNMFLNKFPHPETNGYLHDPMRLSSFAASAPASDATYSSTAATVQPQPLGADLEATIGKIPHAPTKVYQIIVSKVGDGPQILNQRNTFSK